MFTTCNTYVFESVNPCSFSKCPFLRLISSPIPLHWLWTVASPNLADAAESEKLQFVEQKATELCQDWYGLMHLCAPYVISVSYELCLNFCLEYIKNVLLLTVGASNGFQKNIFTRPLNK